MPHLRSDRERKAMFSNMNNPLNNNRGSTQPPSELVKERKLSRRERTDIIVMAGAKEPSKKLMRIKNQPNQPKLPMDVRNFLSKKISKNIREGKPRDQAIAIAFSQTRKKFPAQKEQLKLPRNSPIDQKRFRSFLINIVGLVVALRILRELKK